MCQVSLQLFVKYSYLARFIPCIYIYFCPGMAAKYSLFLKKIVSEYDQEIPQSQTADKPRVPRGRANHKSPDTRKTN